ncbi:hypothetical protein HanRHA438_Chr11g0484441 [Helianthus annuus]|uniref:Uncharacterized protein n=1 Tax=Helianthus annuus TaxID=4232 RepID=A0A9K3MYC9_HELAN|nr:hypothetical protein HanXRQr2_Chr11g0471021 [Helianthus annuus]KAJ0869009.1 hypothetical protein HanRHA438_Chr11g0484441 [Helianthus annuus]
MLFHQTLQSLATQTCDQLHNHKTNYKNMTFNCALPGRKETVGGFNSIIDIQELAIHVQPS